MASKGIIMVSMTMRNSIFFPLNLNLANANPASALRASPRTTVTAHTTTVLIRGFINS